MIEEENRIVLQPLTRDFARRLRGSLQGKISALNVLMESRKEGREP